MSRREEIRNKMEQMKICVIVPTYNNDGTIVDVVKSCAEWCRHIIVVNDGCTDKTHALLADLSAAGSLPSQLELCEYEKNMGKGYALKTGFAKARQLGFDYAITLDADGQHFPTDIPVFLDALEKNPQSLVVGSRNLQSKNMPGKNTFANKFSNFWFTVQTFQRLPDTQTGFRLYPLRRMGSLRWITSRYEAELEMLVFAAWHGVKLLPVKIDVYYPPQGERVTHFRPGYDFFRISVLNTILCFLAVVYGYPSMLWHKMRGK